MILATGFEPFGGEAVNPSWQAVQRLPDSVSGHLVLKARLPVVWYDALTVLEDLVNTHRPRALLLCGQAGGESHMRIERVGVNLCEAKIGDNKGRVLTGEPVVPGGPAAYLSTFPYRDILRRIEGAGIPARFSYSAGCYLCNHVLYGGLHLQATEYPAMNTGFIHVPYLPGQAVGKAAGTPSMALDTIVQALTMALEAMAVEL